MKTNLVVLASVLAVFIGACATPTQERSAVVGGALGAGAGAIIGHQFGEGGRDTGALIGGALGATTGLLYGQEEDSRNAATQYPSVAPPAPPPPPGGPVPRPMNRPAPHPRGDDFRNPYLMPNPQFCAGQWIWDARGGYWQCR